MLTLPTPSPTTPTPVEPAAAGSTATPPAPAAAGTDRWPGAQVLDDPTTAQVLHAAWSGDPAVVVPSPPGAGKTRLVTLLAAALATRADLRVGVAAQTREQAAEVARRVGRLTDRAALIRSGTGPRPDAGATLTVTGRAVRFPADRGGVLIATTAAWLHRDPAHLACDVMVVDEAYQCTYADLGALGAFAGQVVCVGDPGQIDPVVTGATGRWRGNPRGPHLPAPLALRAAHGPAVAVHALPHTWRLGPTTTALLQPTCYPDLPFTSRRPPEHLTSPTGSAVPELIHQPTAVTAGPGDSALAHACAARVRDLLDHHLHTTTGRRLLSTGDLAVVCAHVAQAAAVRALLADLPDVLVGTANQLQGLERTAVVVLHPLAGYRDVGPFAADTGRACVMLSRHRAHASVITDTNSPAALAHADPATPGVAVHTALLDALLGTART